MQKDLRNLAKHRLLLRTLNSSKITRPVLDIELNVNLAVHVGLLVVQTTSLNAGHFWHDL